MALVASLSAGCRSTPALTSAEIRAEVGKDSFWKPHLLLASDARYRSLEIEVDHVEGAGPTAAELESLKKFFEVQCRKPGGVTVRVDKAIPRREAKGKSHKALAELHLNGPESMNAAFVYFLFYDSRLTGLASRQPETLRRPFPGAVFINRAYMRKALWLPGTGDLNRRLVLHEAGHVLGLCGNPAHGDWVHCTNLHCLMNQVLEIRLSKLLLPGPVMPQRDFCADCLADLASYREQPSANNLRYLGPYCVRSEPDYHVLTTPGFVHVVDGRLEEVDLKKLDNQRRGHFVENPKHDGVFYTIEVSLKDVGKLAPSLERDPLEQVRELGAKLREAQK